MPTKQQARTIQHIKSEFKKIFLREISDEEASKIFEIMIGSTQELFKRDRKYNEDHSNQYMQGDLQLCFSPTAIREEIQRVIDTVGIEELEKSSKYKKMYELGNAQLLALALKKNSGVKWFIISQESPDILLIKKNLDALNQKPFDAVPVEVMQIPIDALEEIGEDVEVGIANFIRKKKFNKRYHSNTALLVHLNFNAERIIYFDKIANEINKFVDNPFHQIWLRANTDPTHASQNASRIYPLPLFSINFNIEEAGLYY